MKTFFKKLALYFSIYLIICVIISVVSPYHWGNPWYSTKIQHLEKNHTYENNTYYFGSSRVYRQLDPIIFDSLVNSSSQEKVKSFNLGAPATFTPQVYFLYEHFLNSDLSKSAKYCFIELMEVDLLDDYFLHQERTTYWQNSTDIMFIVNSIYSNNGLNIKKKLKSISNYSISYLENILHLGHFSQQLMHSGYYEEKYLGAKKNGFFSLECDLKTTKSQKVKSHLTNRKNSLLEHPSLLDKRKNTIHEYYNNVTEFYNKVHLERILDLINRSKLEGIELVFILSPRYASQELINLSLVIPDMNFIDMANPVKNDRLYEFKNSFDVGHLNEVGSRKYSELLAIEFLKKNK